MPENIEGGSWSRPIFSSALLPQRQEMLKEVRELRSRPLHTGQKCASQRWYRAAGSSSCSFLCHNLKRRHTSTCPIATLQETVPVGRLSFAPSPNLRIIQFRIVCIPPQQLAGGTSWCVTWVGPRHRHQMCAPTHRNVSRLLGPCHTLLAHSLTLACCTGARLSPPTSQPPCDQWIAGWGSGANSPPQLHTHAHTRTHTHTRPHVWGSLPPTVQ